MTITSQTDPHGLVETMGEAICWEMDGYRVWCHLYRGRIFRRSVGFQDRTVVEFFGPVGEKHDHFDVVGQAEFLDHFKLLAAFTVEIRFALGVGDDRQHTWLAGRIRIVQGLAKPFVPLVGKFHLDRVAVGQDVDASALDALFGGAVPMPSQFVAPQAFLAAGRQVERQAFPSPCGRGRTGEHRAKDQPGEGRK